MQTNLITALLPNLLDFVTYPENRAFYQEQLTRELSKLKTPEILSHNYYLWNPDDYTITQIEDMDMVTYKQEEIQDLNHTDITLTLTGYPWAQIYFHFIEY